jgi:hypothetical protein
VGGGGRSGGVRVVETKKEWVDKRRRTHQLAVTYMCLGRLSEAKEHQAEVIKQKTLLLGERHPDTITASNIMAGLYTMSGEAAKAEKLRTEVLGLRREVLGDGHPDTLNTLEYLALTYVGLGWVTKAELLQIELLASREQALGPCHPDTLRAARHLGVTNQNLGRIDEAAIIFANVLDATKDALGEDHPETLEASSCLGSIYYLLGRTEESETIIKRRVTQEESAARSRSSVDNYIDRYAGAYLRNARKVWGCGRASSGDIEGQKGNLRGPSSRYHQSHARPSQDLSTTGERGTGYGIAHSSGSRSFGDCRTKSPGVCAISRDQVSDPSFLTIGTLHKVQCDHLFIRKMSI